MLDERKPVDVLLRALADAQKRAETAEAMCAYWKGEAERLGEKAGGDARE